RGPSDEEQAERHETTACIGTHQQGHQRPEAEVADPQDAPEEARYGDQIELPVREDAHRTELRRRSEFAAVEAVGGQPEEILQRLRSVQRVAEIQATSPVGSLRGKDLVEKRPAVLDEYSHSKRGAKT